MSLEEIRAIAKSYGVVAGKQPKPDLIKSIQVAEGNFACFGTAQDGECDQGSCLWRADCLESPEQKGQLS